MNQSLLEKLKKQVSILWTLKFRDHHDVKFLDWSHKTKLLILFLSFEKKDEYLRKELIDMLQSCVCKMPSYDKYTDELETYYKIQDTKEELKGLLKSFIEILELREKDLKDEKQKPNKPNKSNKKTPTGGVIYHSTCK